MHNKEGVVMETKMVKDSFEYRRSVYGQAPRENMHPRFTNAVNDRAVFAFKPYSLQNTRAPRHGQRQWVTKNDSSPNEPNCAPPRRPDPNEGRMRCNGVDDSSSPD